MVTINSYIVFWKKKPLFPFSESYTHTYAQYMYIYAY